MGAGPALLMACRKAGIRLAELRPAPLRQLGAAGSPLPPEGSDWVYEQLGPDVLLNIGSGGTDVCSGIVQGGPLQPVYRGEISGRLPRRRRRGLRPRRPPGGGATRRARDPLADAVDAGGVLERRDGAATARPTSSITRASGGTGDWIAFTERGTCVVTGRSDATLNRGGVRLGTGEFYARGRSADEVQDSLVVHLEDPEGGPGELVLFVQPVEGAAVDDDLRARIAATLRRELSPATCPTTCRGPGHPEDAQRQEARAAGQAHPARRAGRRRRRARRARRAGRARRLRGRPPAESPSAPSIADTVGGGWLDA